MESQVEENAIDKKKKEKPFFTFGDAIVIYNGKKIKFKDLKQDGK